MQYRDDGEVNRDKRQKNGWTWREGKGSSEKRKRWED